MATFNANPLFSANSRQVGELLRSIHDGKLALPDFQRNFVWDDRRTVALLRSIMCQYPAGSLLFWTGSETKVFAERAFEGAPELTGRPVELVLDGQQRLTALYTAMTAQGDERYFVRLRELTDHAGDLVDIASVDWDKAIVVLDVNPSKGQPSPTDVDWQYQELALPIAHDSWDEWIESAADYQESEHGLDSKKLRARLRNGVKGYVSFLHTYGFPVVALPATTSLDAVCNIFETLNSTGKPLEVFDLLTARFYPAGVDLRSLWDNAKEDYPALGTFGVDSYGLLQAVSLRARGSAQRSAIIKDLKAEDINAHWADIVSAASDLLDWLQNSEGILSRRWLPYGMLMVPMMAVYPDVSKIKGAQRASVLERLRQFFWCTTFMTNYDQGANSQAGADYSKLKDWLFDPSQPAPEAVADFSVTEEMLLGAKVRRKALHAGLLALTAKNGAKDFHSASKLTPKDADEKRVESHHIFPKAYLLSEGHSAERAELILNRALIDADTNKRIGKRPPSEYLEDMAKEYTAKKVADVLDSHGINSDVDGGARSNDYEQFLMERLTNVSLLIEGATGKKPTPLSESLDPQ